LGLRVLKKPNERELIAYLFILYCGFLYSQTFDYEAISDFDQAKWLANVPIWVMINTEQTCTV
jgi:hypothetical protein